MRLRRLALAVALCVPSLAIGRPAHPLCTVSTRQCLLATTQTYLDALISHDGSNIPLAPDVRRTENGPDNAKGAFEVRESFARTTMIRGVRDARFTVDPAQGEVVVFFLNDITLKDSQSDTTKAGNSTYKVAVSVPPGDYTMHEAERFRIKNGLITEIEIIGHLQTGRDGKSSW